MSVVTTLRVADLATSEAFYLGGLGCELIGRDAGEATVAWRGYRVRLAGPGAEAAKVAPAGGTIFFDGGPADEIEALRDALAARGVVATLVERHWGDRLLSSVDPDGHRVCFWTTASRTPAEWLALYAAGPDALDRALAGLTLEEETRRPAAGGWSVREIVHHIADSEATVLARTKFGLAEPGRSYSGNAFEQDVWARGLDYAGREIGPSVAFFRAIRAHIGQLMGHLPDAWERETVAPDGSRFPAGQMIPMLVSHAFEHIEEIRERRAGD